MNHKKLREWLQLSFVGELTSEEMRVLEDHLLVCEECRTEKKELNALLSHLGESGAGEPSEQLLWEARQSLREALKRETLTESILARLTQGAATTGPSLPGWRRSTDSPGFRRGWTGWFNGFRLGLSGAAAVVVGVFIGYLAFGRGASEAPLTVSSIGAGAEMGGPGIANVQFLDWNQRDGEIEVQYDLVRPVRIRSTIDDDRVQRVLAHALMTGDNPGVRLKAIDALDSQAGRTGRSHGPDVRQALIDATKTDPNVGVRHEALRVLGEMPFDDQIKQTCLYVLQNDNNPGMRVAAINLLSGAQLAGYPVGKDVYDFLAAQSKEENNPVLKARGSVFIEEVNDGE